MLVFPQRSEPPLYHILDSPEMLMSPATPLLQDQIKKLSGYWIGKRYWTGFIGSIHSKICMLDTEDRNNTNIYEPNPLKCHLSELYTNASNARTIFNNYCKKYSQPRHNTHNTSNGGTTTFIDIETEATFDGDVAISSTCFSCILHP